MYNNGASHLSTLNRLKQQYDAIIEDNSSFRESLLVSPYCSKYEKQQSPQQSPVNNEVLQPENSLLDYIKPFENEQLNKTQTKQKMRKKNGCGGDNRKRTEPESDDRVLSDHHLHKLITELKETIRNKDDRIEILEKKLMEFVGKKNMASTDGIYSNPNAYQAGPVTNDIEKRRGGSKMKRTQVSQDKQNQSTTETLLLNYRKQIRFLTYNNQEMFEEIRKVNQFCDKMKNTLKSTLLYAKDLQEKLQEISEKNQELAELNECLILEKREMMENYQEQLRLFKKMKHIWEQMNASQTNQTKQRQSQRSISQRSKSKAKK